MQESGDTAGKFYSNAAPPLQALPPQLFGCHEDFFARPARFTGFRDDFSVEDGREFQALQDTGEVKASRTALLSQEGSTIETAVEIVRGVVPKPQSLGMHSETFRLGNHPSRHRKERDDAALLTQEGNSPAFTATIVLHSNFSRFRVSSVVTLRTSGLALMIFALPWMIHSVSGRKMPSPRRSTAEQQR